MEHTVFKEEFLEEGKEKILTSKYKMLELWAYDPITNELLWHIGETGSLIFEEE